MTRKATLCEMHKQVNRKLNQFIENVSNVGEESITDYLSWKWSEIDKRIQSVKVKPYTRKQESLNGTDFDMEVWIIEKHLSISFAVQAKKFVKSYDGYKRKLRYPKDSGKQLRDLISHANNQGHIPVYALYTRPDETSTCYIPCSDIESYGVFLMKAKPYATNFTAKTAKNRLSRDDMLEKSIPVHALFCYESTKLLSYFVSDSKDMAERLLKGNSNLPTYVEYLLQSIQSGKEVDKEQMQRYIEEFELHKYKQIIVVDKTDGENGRD